MTNSKKLTIDTYDRIARQYTQNFFDDTKDEKPYLDKFFRQLPKASKVLDAGCGPGTFSRIVDDKGFDCYGMDMSEKMIQPTSLRSGFLINLIRV